MKTIYLMPCLVFALTGCVTYDTGPAVAETTVNQSSIFSMYGNWCGLYYPRDISRAAPPVDELDATCMRHDLCYVTQGQFDCGCDQAFEENLAADLLANLYQGKQKIYARSFQQYILTSPCHGTPDGKIGASRFLQNIYINTTRTAGSVFDHLRGSGVDSGEEGADTSVDDPQTPVED